MLFSLLSILLPFSMISGCLLLFTWLTTLLPRPLTTSLQSAPVFTPAVLRFIPCIPSVLVSTCFSDLLLLNTVTPDPWEAIVLSALSFCTGRSPCSIGFWSPFSSCRQDDLLSLLLSCSLSLDGLEGFFLLLVFSLLDLLLFTFSSEVDLFVCADCPSTNTCTNGHFEPLMQPLFLWKNLQATSFLSWDESSCFFISLSSPKRSLLCSMSS